MLDLKLVQKQPEILERNLKVRHSKLSIEDFQKLDGKRRALIAEVETLKSERNRASQEVAQLKREGKDASARIAELGELSGRIKALDAETEEARQAVTDWMMGVPNIPDASVPVGRDETENVEIRRWGTPPSFDFEPKPHWDLGTNLGGLDFERAVREAGSRFVITFGWAAKLERALINFFLDEHEKQGYIEVATPFIVNRATMTGTGQLPKFEEDLFRLREQDYYLIPTAEVTLTNLHSGEVLNEEDLPRGYTAATACFRSEAGAAGRDTRGLIRMHQFNKIEMVRFSHPDDSFNQLELMTGHARQLLEELELPYRQIVLCTGDMGFSSAKTYDLEVWLPAQKTYREISSCSNCVDFQARRANIPQRIRPAHWQNHGRHYRERTAEGRQHRPAQSARALHARRRVHRARQGKVDAMAEEKPFLEFTIDNTWLGSMQTKAVLEGKAEIVCQAGPSSFDLWGPVEMVSAGLVNCILSIVGIYLEHRNMSTEGLHARIVTDMADHPMRISRYAIDIFMPQQEYSERDRKGLGIAIKRCPVRNSLDPAIEKTETFHWD